MNTRAQYYDPQAAELESFVDSIHAEARDGKDVALDSAAAKDYTRDALKQSGMKLPRAVEEVISLMPEEDAARVLDSVLFGAEIYRQQHGVMPTGDVIQAALQQGRSAAYELDPQGRVKSNRPRAALDSVGSTDHHDQISAQPNRIVVAITSAIAEAIPFATYLPTDIGSNEARLGIVSHLAGSSFGSYAQNELMDGVNIGKDYVSAERRITLTLNSDRDAATGQITTTAGGATGVPLLRGRSIVFINGYPCAYEPHSTTGSVANSPISGNITLAGTDYAITGTVTVATGAFSLAFSPALPDGTVVEVEGFIDYEANPSLTPKIMTQVSTYSLFATPSRVIADQTVDSKTQYANELSLDLQSESLMAIRNQFGMERHYKSLAKLMALAQNNTETYDFDWGTQGVDKTRARIWQDAMAVIGVVDQQMAEDTLDHGISHLYVTKNVAAQLQSLPRDLFEPSGVTVRPGIFRVGRLFGRYEVYYTPRVLTETANSSQILAIGRSNQVARCPVVLGDAVAPTYLPLAMDTSMKYQNGFYARNFTCVNPHQPSAKGAALINVTNLF